MRNFSKQTNQKIRKGHITRSVYSDEESTVLLPELDTVEIEILKALGEKFERRARSFQWLLDDDKFLIHKGKKYIANFSYSSDYSCCSLTITEKQKNDHRICEILEDLETEDRVPTRNYCEETYISIFFGFDALQDERKRQMLECDVLPDHHVKFATMVDCYEHIVLNIDDVKEYLKNADLGCEFYNISNFVFDKEKIAKWMHTHKDTLCFSDTTLFNLENQVKQFSRFFEFLAAHSNGFEDDIPADVFHCEQIPLSLLTIDFLLEMLGLEYLKSEKKYGNLRSVQNMQKVDWLITQYILRDTNSLDTKSLGIDSESDNVVWDDLDSIKIESIRFSIKTGVDYETGNDVVKIINEYQSPDDPKAYSFLMNSDCDILLDRDNFYRPLENIEDAYEDCHFYVKNLEELIEEIFDRNCLSDHYLEYLDSLIGEDQIWCDTEFRNANIYIFTDY